MKSTAPVEVAGAIPSTYGGIVQLCAIRNAAEAKIDEAASDQDLAAGQQRRSVFSARCDEIAGGTPRARGRVVQLGTVKNVVLRVVGASCD